MNQNLPNIRPYTDADYNQVKDILVNRDLYYEPNDSQESFSKKISRDPESILVAERNGKIVGTVRYSEDGSMPFIFRLATDGASENIGVGRVLFNYAKQKLFDLGYSEINILVEKDNIKLKEYYKEMGIKEGHDYTWMWTERR